MGSLFFSTIDVSRQAFYRSTLSYAIVNLKPIVPGHVLVLPTRHVARLADLSEPELSSLMRAVQQVGSVIERVYEADGLTVACQDGRAAGQSVPHVHFHLLPRKAVGDRFAGKNNDKIYPALEKAEAEVAQPFKVDADEDRVARSMEDMEKEATWLKGFFE
ncbi:diadenosine hydrolase [Roridomyces roridus]|uniref:Bis(5'-adenosyl)-triphosphatase n=1 Tax=Roridomyces roridus TaxID=1738132 RepID=A0AAD7FHU9_9AGAR|nr:diadenosine hydrolase [Roridomyces roridus]